MPCMTKKSFTKKGIKNQELILDRAIKHFGKVGFARSTLRNIAKACKTSAPRIKYYFKNEDEVFAAAILKMVEDGKFFIQKYEQDILSKNSNPKFADMLKAYLNGMSEWLQNSSSYRKLMLEFYAESSSSKLLNELNLSIMTTGQERILSYLIKETQAPSKKLIDFSVHTHDLVTGAVIKTLVKGDLENLNSRFLNLHSWIAWSFEKWKEN